MKKTMTVNIDGIVFHIDEDAYDRLNQYLETVRRHFARDEGCDEIIAGIESRIAEVFSEKKNDPRRVVTIEDVNEAILQLGEPAQISGEDEGGEKEKSAGEGGETTTEEYAPKRLFRDPDNKYIGGVCGGLGAFFQIDPTWIRVLFVIAFFFYSAGLIVYLILWIVIPKARTMSDRLSMRGEKVNISNIEKSIKEDLRDIRRNLEELGKDRESKKKA